MLTTLLLELGDLSSGQHVGATACNIVARNTLHAFGNHVAQCCIRLANPAQRVAT